MTLASFTVLMADDDFEDIELIENAVTKLEPSTSLHKVRSGKAAIDYLEKLNDNKLPCLIILDYNMPELTGPEVLAWICKQKRYEKIPKIVLSTSRTTSYMNDSMNNGATEYFVKPHNMTELATLAKKIVDYCRNGARIN